MNEKQLRALARKNANKATRAQNKTTKSYDETLDATKPKDDRDTGDADRIFKEMKKREF